MVDRNRKDENGIPRLSIVASIYHVLLLLFSGSALVVVYYKGGYSLPVGPRLVYTLAFGAIGGTLYASRYVIKAVRKGKYENRIFLWQVLTPIHGAILAAVGYVFINGGILSVTIGVRDPRGYDFFVMAFSFLIGTMSEQFVKKLITVAENLFGEKRDIGDLDEE